MDGIFKIHRFKDGKVMSEDKIAYANGEYVLLSDCDKVVDELEQSKDYIVQLKHDLNETNSYFDKYRKETQDRISELESELEVKNNLLKIKNGLCKPPMMTVIVAKTINGHDYVKLEDFMSVVNDLQNCHSDNAE